MRVVERIVIEKMPGDPFVRFAIFVRVAMFFGDGGEHAVARRFGLGSGRTAMGMAQAPDRRNGLEHHQKDDDKTKLSLTDQNLVLWLRHAESGFGPIPFSCGECLNKP